MKKGLLLVFSTAIISGFSIFINKYGVAFSDPYIFVFLKNIIVALLLGSLIIGLKELALLRKINAKQWGLLILIGIIGGGIPFLLFFKGLTLTSAAQGSFIQKTMFIYVAVLAAVFLKEKINKSFTLGALALLGGNLLLLKSLNFSFGWGDLLVLAATLFWAAENTLSRAVLKDGLSGNIVAWARMFFGSLFIAGFLALSGHLDNLAALNFIQIKWVLITSALLFGYIFTWYNGLKYVSVSVATAILMLGSPVTTLLTAMSSGRLSLKDTCASVLITGGLVLIIGFDWLWGRVKSYVRT
jgi:drug/metabolite transporter (DMT)-like permease